ncbi:MAG: polysaccharide biosynthesis protein [Cyanosarcina radialis HA8281-LM2]|jgi:FlaA1/EpsC-like NDP-sugar epimerase/EAL domain-containing protein (putative c-di-GMP-specific phosphodiesterase class I)|nr:polysaccharide biosynthesis protein [Cyanosarcina radialis HA8281-LM2]
MTIEKILKKLIRLNNSHFLAIDTIIFLLTPLLALILRLDVSFEIETYKSSLIFVTLVFLAVKLSVLYRFGFYRRYWRYASIDELTQMAMLMLSAVVLQTFLFYALHFAGVLPPNLPRSLPLIDGMLGLMIIGGIRFSIRAMERMCQKRQGMTPGERVLIIGAGNAGVSLVQEMQRNPSFNLNPVAFIDDDPGKFNLHIRGLTVAGDRDRIPQLVESLSIDRAIVAMPSVSGEIVREIVDICHSIGLRTSTLPGLSEILSDLHGRVRVQSLRDIEIEDLLRREAVKTDIDRVSQFLEGKKVLITGAGGSIGSEICRQVLKCQPTEMLLLGHGENSVFGIEQELKRVLAILKEDGEAQGHIPKLRTLIADIRFPSRLDYAFAEFRPDVIFHAAAHKHVPLMELNSPEAITNNVLGTKNLLDLARRYHVKNFVMISTDKAVNPTSVMGASKRTAEMLVLNAARKSGKAFVVVRFGNVLGSRGSVVPTFKQQIAAGGPITITHPEICRYFMTIPEAVQLVLQAAVIGKGGEVFMLDMGQPVKIVDLAKDLIRLSGYEVGKDIDILFTGLRPGEKLYEELFIPGEKYTPTKHEKILMVHNASRIIPPNLESLVEDVCDAARQNDAPEIVSLLKQLVSEYAPNDYHTQTVPAKQAAKNKDVDLKIDFSEALSAAISAKNEMPLAPLEIGENLPPALEGLRIYYQPIVDLQNNKIIGFEALLRWQHPRRGLISLAEFMPAIEETALIVPIGWWVLREACTRLLAWQHHLPGDRLPIVSVNLSARQFFQADLVDRIAQILAETKLGARHLRLEIPESVVMENPEAASHKLSQLKKLGVQLQVDRLGIGYSFLSRLERLPKLSSYRQFDMLKIDRSLIGQIDVDEESLEIVRRIIAIADELGMQTTAAGIETIAQLAQLKSIKCQYGQGYLFSKPVKSEVAKTLIDMKL